MGVYAYKGLDARGKPVTGAKEAESPKALRTVLRKDGIVVTEVAEARAGKTSAASAAGGKGLRKEVDVQGMFQRIKNAEVAAFTRQIAVLLRAGIPLAEGLGVLVDQIENEKLKSTIGDVRTRVNEGSSLADAIGRHPGVFQDVFISMVRAGETAGNLDEVLFRLADFMDSAEKLKSKVGSAMIYPLIMMIISAIIMTVLMVAVVPQITQLFEDSGETLPINTRMLIWTSKAIAGYWWLFILLIGGGIYGFSAWKKTPAGLLKWDQFKLRAPLIGVVTRQVAVARFARTLGTMLSSGVPLLRALDVSKDILGNAVLKKVIEAARDKIQQGESIAVTLRKSGEFPPVVTHMIAVGERAGSLEAMLANVATAYEQEVDTRLTRLTATLEPLIIVGMGGAVAFVVFSILMPIMKMNQFAQ